MSFEFTKTDLQRINGTFPKRVAQKYRAAYTARATEIFDVFSSIDKKKAEFKRDAPKILEAIKQAISAVEDLLDLNGDATPDLLDILAGRIGSRVEGILSAQDLRAKLVKWQSEFGKPRRGRPRKAVEALLVDALSYAYVKSAGANSRKREQVLRATIHAYNVSKGLRAPDLKISDGMIKGRSRKLKH